MLGFIQILIATICLKNKGYTTEEIMSLIYSNDNFDDILKIEKKLR